MPRIIINADDFGKCHEVNVAIEEQILKGNITSTTIMANADGFDEAIQIAKQYPSISYGIHLCLDEYAPVTTQKAFIEKGIVDESTGLFVKGRIWNVSFDEVLKNAIRDEWDAQIQIIKNAGIIPSHIDSHHHVHTILALKDVLLDVLNKNEINKVRGCDYVTTAKFFKGWKHFSNSNLLKELAYLLLRCSRFNEKNKWVANMRGSIEMTDDFCSVMAFWRNQFYFEKYCKEKIVELECHPGHDKYNKETGLLQLLSGYDKMTYNDL